jgi:NADH:ubiquinone oxidoreductase subunit H
MGSPGALQKKQGEGAKKKQTKKNKPQAIFYIKKMIYLSILTILVPVLLVVAFLTLAERQLMASMQRRVGPQVSGFGGILQPFYDGLKLGVKEPLLPELSASGAFAAAPMISFVLSQIAWVPLFLSDAAFGGLVIMALSSLSVYGVMLAGWASNSKYAFLGCLRSVALMVSYELSLGACLLSIALFTVDSTGMKCLNFVELPDFVDFYGNPNFLPLLALLPVCHLFLVCILAETKRVPFDLPEAKLT